MSTNGKRLARDLFFILLAGVILYQQVYVASKAQPILIFLVIFLIGSVKWLRDDDTPGRYSPFVRVIMSLLGVTLPESFAQNEGGAGSITPEDTPTPSDGAPRSSRRVRSSRSSP